MIDNNDARVRNKFNNDNDNNDINIKDYGKLYDGLVVKGIIIHHYHYYYHHRYYYYYYYRHHHYMIIMIIKVIEMQCF